MIYSLLLMLGMLTSYPAITTGYLAPDAVREILSCAGIPMVPEMVSPSKDELIAFAEKTGYPVVAKVVGPVHKSDVGGVTLNIRTAEHLALEFDRMMQIPDATGVMVQKSQSNRNSISILCSAGFR